MPPKTAAFDPTETVSKPLLHRPIETTTHIGLNPSYSDRILCVCSADMIIRHFVTALRKQDWSTVAIEFLIVVVGIFVGLQVDNWNQARLDRIREASLLPRIREDVTSTNEVLDRWQKLREYSNQQHLLWINASAADIEDMSSSDLDKHIYEAVWIYTSPFIIDGTLEQLKSNGELQILKSDAAQIAITDFYRLSERLNENVAAREAIMTNLVDPFLIDNYPAQQYMSNLSNPTVYPGPAMEIGILPPAVPEDMRHLLLDRRFQNLMAYRLAADNIIQLDVNAIRAVQNELLDAIEKRERELGSYVETSP
jgi:hypothetical protein